MRRDSSSRIRQRRAEITAESQAKGELCAGPTLNDAGQSRVY